MLKDLTVYAFTNIKFEFYKPEDLKDLEKINKKRIKIETSIK